MAGGPKRHGLGGVQGGPSQEKGFCCMRLIKFLVRDNVKDWDVWHGAHLQAAQKNCPYKGVCDKAPKVQVVRSKPIQLEFYFGISISIVVWKRKN